MPTKKDDPYQYETELCSDFIEILKRHHPRWKPYPETAGYDILLSHKDNKYQIGIEAKLRLTPKALCQVLPWKYSYGCYGPDFKAVLIPKNKSYSELETIALHLGISILKLDRNDHYYSSLRLPFDKSYNPNTYDDKEWHNFCPTERIRLPEVTPDVRAGARSPRQLTQWKIKAIKLLILLEQRPVTRKDFKALQLSTQLWLDPRNGWLQKHPEGGYITSPRTPDLFDQHPRAYVQLRKHQDQWEKLLRY